MPLFHFSLPNIQYFLKRNLTLLFLSLAIRTFATGMVVIFEPIYLYLFFDKSISLTLLFLGAAHGLYGLLAVYGGKAIAKFGLRNCIFVSHLLFFGYFLFLYLLPGAPWLIALALPLKALGMTFFWPAFHTDFVRFSQKKRKGLEVGKLQAVRIVPVIAAPLIGGWLVAEFGYPVLFVVVLITLLVSVLPLFLSKEKQENYTDSYEKAWLRVFKRENRSTSFALAAAGIEIGINRYIWPIFLAVLAISYLDIGGLSSFALAVSVLFALYLGRVADSSRRFNLLKIGSLLTSLAWVLKFFVRTPLDALLAQSLYKPFRTSALIPFSAIFYEKAAARKDDADEFIIYREIILNLSRFFFFLLLAVLFVFLPQINITFIFAALLSLAFVLLGRKNAKPNLPSRARRV